MEALIGVRKAAKSAGSHAETIGVDRHRNDGVLVLGAAENSE